MICCSDSEYCIPIFFPLVIGHIFAVKLNQCCNRGLVYLIHLIIFKMVKHLAKEREKKNAENVGRTSCHAENPIRVCCHHG